MARLVKGSNDAELVGSENTVIVDRQLEELAVRFDSGALERAAMRLELNDLLTLARFPTLPHAAIHHSIASLHIVLLSISSLHNSASVLQVTPWQLLRLDVKSRADAIWQKMWRRLSKLRRPPTRHKQRKALASSQIRFVLRLLLLPIFHAEVTTAKILESFRQVSLVAESVVAFVLLCVHLSLVPSPAYSPPSRFIPTLDPAPAPDRMLRTGRKRKRSWRCGCKYGGRYVLFRAHVISTEDDMSPPSGSWSCYAIDRNHASLRWQRSVELHSSSSDLSMEYATAWMRRQSIPHFIVESLMRLERKTSDSTNGRIALSFLLQTAIQCGMFDPPLHYSNHSPTHRSVLPSIVQAHHLQTSSDSFLYSLHFCLLALSPNDQVQLTAIGQITVTDSDSSLSSLRSQLEATRLPRAQTPLPPFQFFLDGTALPVEDEQLRPTLDLLPFAVLLLATGTNHQGDIEQHLRSLRKRWRHQLPAVRELYERTSQAVIHQVTKPHRLTSSRHIEIEMYPMDQTFTRSTSDTVASLFLDWHAFVQFQQLQDSTSIYQSPDKSKAQRKQHKSELDRIIDEASAESVRPVPTPAELEVLSLPHRPFRPAKEYLRPLYATVSITSRSTAVVNRSIGGFLLETLATATAEHPVRLVVGNDECVLHINGPRLENSTELSFVRDRSCPVDMLLTFREAYVWEVQKLPKRHPPPRWLCDVLRVVTHPTYDFVDRHSVSSWPFPIQFFRVSVPHITIESIVEATFWSHGIDWQPYWRQADVVSDLLRVKYTAMCQSHPPSFSIDSIKFSKLLRECGLQPARLSVGDAAFLFTANRVPGSSYEMVFDGFEAAMRWIAHQVYSDQDEDETKLRRLCFDWLIRAPGMQSIWEPLIHRWRRAEKLQRMAVAASHYCAATRIRASWKRFVTRRRLIDVLTRLKLERRAAAAIQSIVRMRRKRRYYLLLKACAIQTQLFIRARRQLRELRHQRALYVVAMRSRLQKWMRQRLRVLRCWKIINAAWLARRARILEKRSRLMCASVHALEGRYLRVSLYRAPVTTVAGEETEKEYELEVLDPETSWWRSIRVTQDLLDQLESEAQTMLGRVKPSHARLRKRWTLAVVMERLRLKTSRFVGSITKPASHRRGEQSRRDDCIVQFYRDPIQTSLGRLLFQGSVVVHCGRFPSCSFVRLLCRSHHCSLLVYFPGSSSSVWRRFEFTTVFAYRIFQFSHLRGLVFPDDSDQDTLPDTMICRAFVVVAVTKMLDQVLAMRSLLQYLLQYGTRKPTREMLPEEIARREREHQLQLERQCRAALAHQLYLVLITQANTRRLLSMRAVQRRALASYIKCFDATRTRILYRYQREHDTLEYMSKPRSLRDRDVPSPVDEWLVNALGDESHKFFNPLRGVFSRFNDVSAAIRVQRWFRRAMWTCLFEPWDLRSLTQALQFHHGIHPPSDPTLDLTLTVHYALQRHTIHHDYKAAQALYEAVLKVDPTHCAALVGLALLLIYSCRYPAKQTWTRGLQLLSTAHKADSNLSTSLSSIEQNCFRWATYLNLKDANALGSFAVYLQHVRRELDVAERLYRRAIDLDPSNECVIENYLRLQRERTPHGLYSAAGPSKIALWRAQQVAIVHNEWRELEDDGASEPAARRFYQHLRTGKCVWTLDQSSA